MGWGPPAPIFRVADLRASQHYYQHVLGFELDWDYQDEMVSVSRDHCTIFLCPGDQSNYRSWVWIGAQDVEAIHEELRARGALIRQPPTNFSWALELQVTDPDGNVLRIGSEPKADVPYGPWLDASGRLWQPQADGAWLQIPVP